MDIRQQTKKTLQEVGIPVTTFCKKMEMSTTAYYRWESGDLRLSTEKESKIRQYINKLSEVF